MLRGRQAAGWVHIEDVKEAGYRIQPGFSGAPVWDETLDGVAGMVVAADGQPDVRAAFMIPTDALVSAWPPLGSRAIPPCPYRGLFAFREQDASVFYGRDAVSAALAEAIGERPFVAVLGASGSGKSSVVFAGLVPRLRAKGTWTISSFRPGARPFHSLAAAFIALLDGQMSETDRMLEVGKLAEALRQDELRVVDVVRRVLEKTAASRLLLVDQFEELYTLAETPEDQVLFLDRLLSGSRDPDLHIVVTLRADFLGYALSYRPFADALQHADLMLGPMNRRELREVVERPARALGVEIQEGLTTRILDAVGEEPGNLPLLEFTLTLLWDRQERGFLAHSAYEAAGGVEGALAGYAEEVYRRLSDQDKQRAQRVLVQLVRPGERVQDARRVATRDEVGEDNWDLITRLADARLVVTGREEQTSAEAVEIVHEALIAGWERLHQWVEADRAFRLWQERLRSALRQWETTGHDEGALMRGAFLAQAVGWKASRWHDLRPAETEFIDASVSAMEEGERAREAVRQRELAQARALAEEQKQRADAERQRAEEQKQRAELERQRAEEQAGYARFRGKQAMALVLVVFAAYTAGFANLLATRGQLVDEVLNTNLTTARVAGQAIQANFAVRLQLVGAVAQSPSLVEKVQRRDWAKAVADLRLMREIDATIRRATLLDLTGAVRATASSDSALLDAQRIGRDQSACDCFRMALAKGGPYFSATVHSDDGPLYLTLSSAVRTADAEPIGVLVAEVPVTVLGLLINPFGVPNGGSVNVFSADGKQLTNVPRPGQPYASYEVFQRAAVKSSDKLRARVPGKTRERLMAYQRVEDPGWVVLVEQPTSAAASVAALTKRLVGFGAFINLILIAGAVLARRQFRQIDDQRARFSFHRRWIHQRR